jgi:hypothetical protein
MQTQQASVIWGGARRDILILLAEPTPEYWITDLLDDQIVLYRGADQHYQLTGQIAGLEIIGFLHFENWDKLPNLPILWQLPQWDPLPLDQLLKRKQLILRSEQE